MKQCTRRDGRYVNSLEQVRERYGKPCTNRVRWWLDAMRERPGLRQPKSLSCLQRKTQVGISTWRIYFGVAILLASPSDNLVLSCLSNSTLPHATSPWSCPPCSLNRSFLFLIAMSSLFSSPWDLTIVCEGSSRHHAWTSPRNNVFQGEYCGLIDFVGHIVMIDGRRRSRFWDVERARSRPWNGKACRRGETRSHMHIVSWKPI